MTEPYEVFQVAPCGCQLRENRTHPVMGVIRLCPEHRCNHVPDPVSGGHICAHPLPWEAASALEAGLRAVAELKARADGE